MFYRPRSRYLQARLLTRRWLLPYQITSTYDGWHFSSGWYISDPMTLNNDWQQLGHSEVFGYPILQTLFHTTLSRVDTCRPILVHWQQCTLQTNPDRPHIWPKPMMITCRYYLDYSNTYRRFGLPKTYSDSTDTPIFLTSDIISRPKAYFIYTALFWHITASLI